MDERIILIIEITVGYFITALVTVFYGVFAPWYKRAEGRYIFGLLAALTLVLTNSIIRIYYPYDGRMPGMILFGLYIIAMTAMGYGIWRAQVGRHRTRKFVKAEKERHRQL